MTILTYGLLIILAAQVVFGIAPVPRRKYLRHYHHKNAGPGHSAEVGNSSLYLTSASAFTSSQSLRSAMCTLASSCTRSKVTVTITIGESVSGGPIQLNTTSPITQSYPMSMSSSAVDQTSLPFSATSTSTSNKSAFSNTPDPTNGVCSTDPMNETSTTAYFGLNVVNTRPQAPGLPPYWKQPLDWEQAFQVIKQNFPNINAVRMYSTTDVNSTEPKGYVPHLMNALPAAAKHSLKILIGIWSGGEGHEGRNSQETEALEDAIKVYGCDNIAAVSVGNEDLNDINVNYAYMDDEGRNAMKAKVVDLLVGQMSSARRVLRRNGCCNIPVTHADTWNEEFNTEAPWVQKLLANCDQAIITNIFPYWGNSSIAGSFDMLQYQVNMTNNAVKRYGKQLWLGETGWPALDNGNHNSHGTNQGVAQQYFDQIGCQILKGNGTAFYYVDWDEDKKTGTAPAFGLFDFTGKPLMDLSCNNFKPDMRLLDSNPVWFGGRGA